MATATLAPAPRRPQAVNPFYAAVAAVPVDRVRSIRAALETGDVDAVLVALDFPATLQAIRGAA